MVSTLDGINTFFFCDETKFSTNNGDVEDAIYYLAVVVDKSNVSKLSAELRDTLKKHTKAAIFHATNVFKEGRPRIDLMMQIADLFIQYKVQSFCFKYERAKMYIPTKTLNTLNNEIIDFNNSEFQALFYFLIALNTHLIETPTLIAKDVSMFFDRNVYGRAGTESFNFPSKHFFIRQMTFVNKSQIGLLALPDYLAYIFRKSKKSQNKFDGGDRQIETSILVINCYTALIKIQQAKLFNFITVSDENVLRSFEYITAK